MNNLRKGNSLLLKSFTHHIKYLVWIFIASCLSMIIFSLYVVILKTNSANEIEKTKSIYGSYIYKFSNLSKQEVDLAIDDSHTDSYNIVKSINGENDGECFNYLGIDTSFFDYSNYELVQGTYPNKENEVLAQKWYLFQLGIEPDEMIGAKVKLVNPETGKKELKTVTGLFYVHYMDLLSDSGGGIPFFILNQNNSFFENSEYSIYISVKDVKNAETHAIDLQHRIYDESEYYSDYEMNYAMLEAMGTTETARSRQYQQNIIYLAIVIVILVFVGSVLHNVTAICLYKWRKIISIYKLIGIHMKKVIHMILALFLSVTLMGYLLGILISLFITYLITKCSFHLFQLNISENIVVPYFHLIVAGILLLGLTTLMILIKTHKYQIMTAAKVTSSQKEGKIQYTANRNGIFQKKRFACLKMALRNCMYYGSRKLFLSLSIALCIVMLFMINVQFETNIKSTDNNDQFKYRFEVENYYVMNRSGDPIESVKKLYQKIVDIIQQNGYKIYYNTGYITDFQLNKSDLSNEYKNHMKETASGYMELLNSKKTLGTTISIMGYSKDMLKELCKDNNIAQLQDNEAIMLSRTTDKNGSGCYRIEPKLGEEYDIDTIKLQNDDQWYTAQVKIKATIDHLLVYPQTDMSTLCLIIGIDSYNKWFNDDYVNSFYVNDLDKNVLHKVQDILTGTNYIKVIDQKEEMEQANANYRQKIGVFLMVIFLCCLVASFNIQLQSIYEFDSRKNEFYLLHLVGISQMKQKFIIIVEAVNIYLLGFVIGIAASKLAMILVYKLAIVKSAKLHFQLILGCSMILVIFMFLSIFLAIRRVLKVTNGNN